MEAVIIIANFSNRNNEAPIYGWIEKEDRENNNYILLTEDGEHIHFTGFSQKLFETLIVRANEYKRIGFYGLMEMWQVCQNGLAQERANPLSLIYTGEENA